MQGKKIVWFSYRYECYDMDNGFHTDMSVMKWTMVLELEDGELSVGCNEQNFYLIPVLFFLTKVEKDSNIRGYLFFFFFFPFDLLLLHNYDNYESL